MQIIFSQNQRIKLWHRGSKKACEALIEDAYNGNLKVALPQTHSIHISSGDEVDIEVALSDDALYITTGRVAEGLTPEDTSCMLLDLSDFRRFQRRQHQRLPIRLNAHYKKVQQSSKQEALILDISVMGLLLATQTPLPKGAHIDLEYELGTEQATLQMTAKGSVVREHQGNTELGWPYQYGVATIEMPTVNRTKLHSYIDRRLSSKTHAS